MSIIDDALSANPRLSEGYDPANSGRPAPKIAVLTCADPRLSGLLDLLGLAAADVDMMRNVGTVVDADTIRSLIVSTRVLGTREIMIVNHNECGLTAFTGTELEQRLRSETGRAPIEPVSFFTFTDAEQNTREQMLKVRSHPWISPDIPVRGFLFDVHTGRLAEVSPDGGDR